jgi:hypothetical protein
MSEHRLRVQGYCPKGHASRVEVSTFCATLIDWIYARRHDPHRRMCHACGKGYRLDQFSWREVKEEEEELDE